MKNIKFPKGLVLSSGIIERMSGIYSGNILEKLARETKFIQRSTTSVSGAMFFTSNVFQEKCLSETSLNDQCDFLKDEYDVNLSKQSLDERYNTYSVAFMKACFGYIIQKVLVKHNFEQLSARFGRIRLADATSFQLPSKLAAFYQSAGGDTSGSSVKMQYEYDVITGNFLDLQLGCGRENDAVYLKKCEIPFQIGDLLLKDLGYYKHGYFEKIHNAGAFFISRYKSQTNLYTQVLDKWVEIDLSQALEKTKSMADCRFFLGKEKIPVRLVCQRVPPKVEAERLAKTRKEAKRKHWNMSEIREQLCGFNIFITNLDESVNAEMVIELYALRWQIELIFKIWKSLFQINQIGQTNIFRFECYLFGRLIAICLSQNVQNLFKEYLCNHGFEPSEWKGFKILKKNALLS